MLRDQGLSKKNIDSVLHALILCKIRCALCAWGGHITEANKGQINAFLRRMHRYGYVTVVYNIDDLICAVDAKLFSSMCKVHHCINYLLPKVKTSDYSLRKRDHHYELPSWQYSLFRNSFVIHCLQIQVTIFLLLTVAMSFCLFLHVRLLCDNKYT